EDMYNDLMNLGRIFDVEADAETVVDGYRAELAEFTDSLETGEPLRVAVASDHTTSSESGHHTADPVPILLWGPGVAPDEVERFDESAVAGGGLQRFPLELLLGRLFDLA
ncbi:MAG: hypothetical protein AAF725_24205, partial [Acidobacteriota bacterium]